MKTRQTCTTAAAAGTVFAHLNTDTTTNVPAGARGSTAKSIDHGAGATRENDLGIVQPGAK